MEKYRRSVFVVVYLKEGKKIKYILLKRKLHWKGWEFPKEGIEGSEREEDAARRGVKEETGLNIKGQIIDLKIHGKYPYKRKLTDRPGFIGQTYSLYAAEVAGGKIKMDEHEHSEYEWLEFNEAIKRLTWKNQIDSLRIANAYIAYKNFRKFVTKSGILIIGGKDENSNEELVKQVEPEEYVFHTAAPGSPFVNIKGKPNEEEIHEAAIFCAKYSRDWREHKKDINVNLFKGKDIYKKQGMKAGTFGVKSLKMIKIKAEDIKRFEKESAK